MSTALSDYNQPSQTSIIVKDIIMLTAKEDCVRYFANRFRKNATWRIGKAIKFPSDGRNALAAQHLLELKSSIEISDAMWDRLAPHYDEADVSWRMAVSETNGHVGFRQHPRDFAAWVDNLLSTLTANKAVRK